MAERRMFAKTIIDSDAFLDMPLSTQSLYFHLSMRADDDGFINNPKKIQRVIGASDDDLKLLIAKSFLIPFENGIVVIKHWRIHNYIQNDRYKETVYLEEKGMLKVKKNKAYTVNLNEVDTECIHDVSKVETQDRLEDIVSTPLPNEDATKRKINYQQIIDLFNDTCVSFPRVVALSEDRKKTIRARLNTYSLDDIKELFTKAEASDFLKGKNDKNWSANFDWLMKDRNLVKVLEGNYDNRSKASTPSGMTEEERVAMWNNWGVEKKEDKHDGEDLPYM